MLLQHAAAPAHWGKSPDLRLTSTSLSDYSKRIFFVKLLRKICRMLSVRCGTAESKKKNLVLTVPASLIANFSSVPSPQYYLYKFL